MVFVDNCYGEFVEALEPPSVGADLIAGSLIKNPGGTLVRTGGYVAGRPSLVAAAKNRLAAPGVGGGATLGQNGLVLQGLFLAPTTVGESLKGAMLCAEVLGGVYGLECNPPPGARRTDMIQAIKLRKRDRLIKFCEEVQKASPVGAHIRPTPGATEGYGDEVIFADGCFVDGATAELSADGPLREPFTVFAQGGTHHMHWAIVLEAAIEAMGLDELRLEPAGGQGGGQGVD